MLEWNGDEFKRQLREKQAQCILGAAVYFEARQVEAVNVSNQHGTAPSKPGEYPHKGTGFGQANIIHEPATIAAVMTDLVVRVGESINAKYMLVLELARGRLGFQETLRRFWAQIGAYAVSGRFKG